MIDQKLKAHRIRPTGIRKAILNLFVEADFALSHADIENALASQCDRVTIYRTLDRFVENGLIHKVVDDSNIAKYALCDSGKCGVHAHHDQHFHFRCERCGRTYCLDMSTLPRVNIPDGYMLHSSHFSGEGVCKHCRD